eukprot:gene4852-6199_t
MATKRNLADIVDLLIETRLVDVNGQDRDGRTPLFWASFNNSIACAKLLILANADKTITDRIVSDLSSEDGHGSSSSNESSPDSGSD